MRALPFLLLLAACADVRGEPEDYTTWYQPGVVLDVEEPLEYTDQPYAAPNAGEAIGDFKASLFPVSGGDPVFAVGDGYGAAGCPSSESSELPFEIEGVVTLHPRYYFKTEGCDGDEKYYGSYFIEDATGGFFVLGDSKVAHFDMGDRVRLKVRGVRTTFDVDMVYAHDVLSVERGPEPIYYEEMLIQPSDIATSRGEVGRTKRIVGTVLSEKDTFGEFSVEGDNGEIYWVSLDAELNRRGIGFPIGTRLQVTGPMLYSFSTFRIVVMRVGQLEVLD
ncbi:MAG: hypothetical protein EP330_28680 [Deltaproteobacteria bacterium]|nr:MAG: hypothetical protein EP330_28680 [Deltaproteobacteria bacterium]